MIGKAGAIAQRGAHQMLKVCLAIVRVSSEGVRVIHRCVRECCTVPPSEQTKRKLRLVHLGSMKTMLCFAIQQRVARR
eukprot:SAG11_NODE_353_length_10348_cov_6.938335_13_plen_78_part_00